MYIGLIWVVGFPQLYVKLFENLILIDFILL